MHIFSYMYMHVDVHMYACVCIHTHACIHTHTYTCSVVSSVLNALRPPHTCYTYIQMDNA